MYLLQFLLTLATFQFGFCSVGNSSPHFEKCTHKCQLLNCTKDGIDFINSNKQPIILQLLSWDCESECKYECMWKTTESFIGRNWKVPQFYGKWPFARFLGVQEPASFIFSIMNLYTQILGFTNFRSNVRPDSPMYWLWQCASAVGINGWLWSIVFHARDLPFTEFMDYTCAYSIILMHCYCMVQRLFHGMPRFLNIIITTFYLAFFANHAIYLRTGRVDYGYNMKLNLITGGVTVLSWFIWSFWNRKKQPYLWKSAAFFSLMALGTSLEIFDFPPVLWTLDSHAIWHLVTAVICPLFYSFIIDDCNYLRKMAEFKPKNQ